MPRKTRTMPTPRPFLKWAGGKGALLHELLPRVEQARPFSRYFEPFVGGGALFFELARQGKLPPEATLADANPHLIETYQGVRDCPAEVIRLLQHHQNRHSRDYFYEIRAKNPEKLPEKAARIIYLNRTCFNGLYRENSRGRFNVPIGRYKNPRICDATNLNACSRTLTKVNLALQPFDMLCKNIQTGDFVYFDPPYHPLSKTASFTAYARCGFGEEKQRLLAHVFAKLAKKGAKLLLSNSMTDLVCELYAGFTIEQVYAARSVNSNPNRRGKVPEALVRNF